MVVALPLLYGCIIDKFGTVCSVYRRLIGRRAGLLLLRLTELRAYMKAIVARTRVVRWIDLCTQLSNIRKALLNGWASFLRVTLPRTVFTVRLWTLKRSIWLQGEVLDIPTLVGRKDPFFLTAAPPSLVRLVELF